MLLHIASIALLSAMILFTSVACDCVRAHVSACNALALACILYHSFIHTIRSSFSFSLCDRNRLRTAHRHSGAFVCWCMACTALCVPVHISASRGRSCWLCSSSIIFVSLSGCTYARLRVIVCVCACVLVPNCNEIVILPDRLGAIHIFRSFSTLHISKARMFIVLR